MKRPLEEVLKQDFSKLVRKEKNSDAFIDFIKRVRTIKELTGLAAKNKTSTALAHKIRSNALTNLVTSLEVFFRDYIIENPTIWSSKGIESFLTQKISLSQAFEIAQIRKLKPHHLITEVISFQNMDSIGSTFSKLIDADFFTAIEVQMRDNFYEQINGIKSWRPDIFELYRLRNKIVHENHDPKLSHKAIGKYIDLSQTFAACLVLLGIFRYTDEKK